MSWEFKSPEGVSIATMSVVNSKDVWEQEFWPALERAFSAGLTDKQLVKAMAAARSESNRWLGHQGWDEPVAAIVRAAILSLDTTAPKV